MANATKGLSEEQRQRVLQLTAQIETLDVELQLILRQISPPQSAVDLRSRNIDETQAIDLRSRLKTFSADWDRPETAIYD